MKKKMKIEGMRCGGCEGRVKRMLEALPQVDRVTASHEAGAAEVILNAEIPDEVLKKTVEDLGFFVTGIE
ncbi:MAG: heavy-metal-associated domain-containing protein [Clostridia bacterium]|nr:heavy-metal-associated domain-containing protein [Clostridia bacterium]